LASIDQLLEFRKASNSVFAQIAKRSTVYSFGFAQFNGEFEREGIRYIIRDQELSRLSVPFKTYQTLRNLNADLVVVHGVNNYLQVICLRMMLKKSTRILVQHHGEMPKGFLNRMLIAMTNTCINGYLFTSKDSALALNIPLTKTYELMEGSTNFVKEDKQQARHKLGLPQNETVYLWVGRLIPIKDPLFFLNAFLRFIQMQSGQSLYMIYEDEQLLESCKVLCKGNSRIIFVGKVKHIELQTWYNAADFFVSSSKHEGSGYALCEAMACACIPIVPSIGAFRFMTGNGSCSLMFDSGNSDSLLQALNHSLTLDKGKFQINVENQFNEKLSFEAIAKDLNRIGNLIRHSNK